MEIKTIPGGFKVPDDTHLGKWQRECGKLDHDEFLVPLACKYIKPGTCVLDVGAFNGDHTIAYSKTVREEGLVIAIEPGETAYECLQHNVHLFPFKNVATIQAAVAADEQLLFHREQENLGAAYVCPEVVLKNKEDVGHAVTCLTLDSIYEELGRGLSVSFIKMDIEGYELRALMGAEQMLHRLRPTWLIEINKEALERAGNNPDQIFKMLMDHAYRISLVQPECNWDSPQYDVLCQPI